MKMNQFMSELKNIYMGYFPDSRINVEYNNRFYASISISMLLSGNKNECANGYSDNDLFSIDLSIYDSVNREFSKDTTTESELNDVVIEKYRAHYTTNPTNQYCVYGHRNLKFRKTTGTPEKIIKYFDGLCNQLKNALAEDLSNGNIHKNHFEIVSKKLGVNYGKV